MNIPADLRYTKDHEWAKDRGDGTAIVGITDYAQDALGDITYLELPDVGADVQARETCGVIESVKTFSDLYAPLSGTVTETNPAIEDNEAIVNESPYNEGWFFAIEMSDPLQLETLLTADEYAAHLESSE